MTKQTVLIGLVWLCLLYSVPVADAVDFTYRGVKFGMTREEVSKLVPPEQESRRAAGRKSFGDKKVTFEFDDKDQLYAVEISYLIPHPVPLMRDAMRKALQKKYGVSTPSEKVSDLGDVLVAIEESHISNQRYLRTTITHKRLYNEYLDRLAAQLAPSLED